MAVIEEKLYSLLMSVLITRFPYESAYGGEEYHTLRLAQYLTQNGESVCLFSSCPVLRDLFERSSFRRFPALRIPSPVTHLHLLAFIVLSPFAFAYFCTKFFFNFRTFTVLYALSLPDKLLLSPLFILTNKRVVWVEHQGLLRWFTHSPLLFVYKYLSRRVHIVPISPYNTSVLQLCGIPASALCPIEHGINVDFYVPSENLKHHSVLYCGRLSEEKGFAVLLLALESVFLVDSTLQFVCIGKGALLQNLQEFALRWPGRVMYYESRTQEQLRQEYQDAKVLVLPSISHHETYGLVAVEAISCGTLAIVTSMCGVSLSLQKILPESVIKPNDVSALCSSIHSALAQNISPQYLHSLAQAHWNEQRMFTEYYHTLCK
jgi:glycosyltransferase involved in cell wall biosynthesis